MSDIDDIMEKASGDGLAVSGELLPLVYDELRACAERQMAKQAPGQTIQATALVHEAWIRLTTNSDRQWNDRAHFFRAASLAMRHILVNRAKAKSAEKRKVPEGYLNIDISELEVADVAQDDLIRLVDDMLKQLETEDPDSARLVTLKFFGGLTNEELADTEGVTSRTIERRWSYARSRLFVMIRNEIA